MTVRLGSILAICVGLGTATPVHADEGAAVVSARELAISGLEDYKSGRFDQAANKLATAYATVKLPTLAFYTAHCLEKTGRLVQAYQLYIEATHLQVSQGDLRVQQAAQADAAKARDALLPRIPRLRVILSGTRGSETSIYVNNAFVELRLLEAGYLVNPGRVTIVAKRGAQTRATGVDLLEGQASTVRLAFDPSSPTSSDASVTATTSHARPSSHTLTWLAAGVGVAGLATGIVAGLVGLKRRSDLLDQCPDRNCPPEYWARVDQYRTLRTVSTVGFVVGASGAATAVALELWVPQQDTKALPSGQAQAMGFELHGRF